MTLLGLEPERPRRDDGLARYGALGLQFAASVGLLAWGGFWLDGKLGTSPWFLIGGAFLGFAGGFLAIVRAVPPSKPASGRASPPASRRGDGPSAGPGGMDGDRRP